MKVHVFVCSKLNTLRINLIEYKIFKVHKWFTLFIYLFGIHLNIFIPYLHSETGLGPGL